MAVLAVDSRVIAGGSARVTVLRECAVSGPWVVYLLSFFFFQAEDGIRDKLVTGVQTCVFFQAEDGIRDKLVTGVQTCCSSDLGIAWCCSRCFWARLVCWTTCWSKKSRARGVPSACLSDAVSCAAAGRVSVTLESQPRLVRGEVKAMRRIRIALVVAALFAGAAVSLHAE